MVLTLLKPLKAPAWRAVIWLSLRFKWSKFFRLRRALDGTSLSSFFDSTKWLRLLPCEEILAAPNVCNPTNKSISFSNVAVRIIEWPVVEYYWRIIQMPLSIPSAQLLPMLSAEQLHANFILVNVWCLSNIKNTYCSCACISVQFSFPWICDRQASECYYFESWNIVWCAPFFSVWHCRAGT